MVIKRIKQYFILSPLVILLALPKVSKVLTSDNFMTWVYVLLGISLVANISVVFYVKSKFKKMKADSYDII